MAIKKINLPFKEPISKPDGTLTQQWLNAFVSLQQTLNACVDKLNTL